MVCQAAARGDLMGLGVCRIGIELHGRISAAGVREVLAEAIRCDCTPKDPENITAMLGALK